MSRKLNIAVCSSFYKQIVEKSKELFRQDSVVELCFRQFDDVGDNSEMLECMENAEIMVCSLSQFTKSLDDFKPTTTKWVQSTSAGMDRIWKADDEQNRLKLRSCTFTKLGGTFGRPMAEYVVAGVIALERNFRLMYEQQKQKLWDKNRCGYKCSSVVPLKTQLWKDRLFVYTNPTPHLIYRNQI